MKRNEYIGGRVLAARLQRHAVLYSVRHTSFPLPHSKAEIRSSGAKEARRGSHVMIMLCPSFCQVMPCDFLAEVHPCRTTPLRASGDRTCKRLCFERQSL